MQPPDLGPRWEWLALLGAITTGISIMWTAAKEPAAEVAGVVLKGILGGLLSVAFLTVVHAVHGLPPTWEFGTAATLGLTSVEAAGKALRSILGRNDHE